MFVVAVIVLYCIAHFCGMFKGIQRPFAVYFNKHSVQQRLKEVNKLTSCYSSTRTHCSPLPPPKTPLPVGDTRFLKPKDSIHTPSGTSIGSAVFAEPTVVPSTQRQRQITERRTLVYSNSSHRQLLAVLTMRPNNSHPSSEYSRPP